jgi:hypothetical protein
MSDAPQVCFQIDGVTLLVVDDDQSFRRALRRLLQLERISVIEADGGEAAIRAIEEDESQVIDAVVTDMAMPAGSGPELIAVLREHRPSLPLVAMTAWTPLPSGLPPGTRPAEAIRAEGTDRCGRNAGPHARRDTAASTANARGCGGISCIGRTAIVDSERSAGQEW